MLLLLVAVYVLVVLRTAWISDDAYMTMRTVDNFVGGHGLTWNVSERVQAYTHPLWMLLLSAVYAFTREAYFTNIVLGVVLSTAAFALIVLRLARRPHRGLLAGGLLLLSKAFVDFSTSGLEDSLTYVVAAAFAVAVLEARASRRRVLWCALAAGLAMLNRLDLGLLLLPCLGVVTWEQARGKGEEKWRAVRWQFALGLSPVAAWELFSLFYYGFPFPNTAYAKLNTGVPRVELIAQGLRYLWNSIELDPVTLAATAWALVLAFAGGCARRRALAAGVALYLLYTVLVGGDFMSGRFLAAPLCVAAILLARADMRPVTAWTGLVVMLVLGLGASRCPVWSGSDYAHEVIPRHGVADERGWYYPHTGLLRWRRERPLPDHRWVLWGRDLRRRAESGERIVYVQDGVGFLGYEAGPEVVVVDVLALGDPLLARLPARDARTGRWRIGHFERELPEGYLETVYRGENVLGDRRLAGYYEQLSLVTRGPLLSWGRLAAIWRLNTGPQRLDPRPAYRSVFEGGPAFPAPRPVGATEPPPGWGPAAPTIP